ncbi:hypothetical protein D9757_002161 [Collybiopsis confluens]|uniref:G domain-containing protein n=1 Tax=Collybiopsis confluens TaxID=2823264 RepID=A0A8H5I061_9AGAR|nr:hypothetical protein D9757_002161 [Collybiopsis confluens]
MVTTHNIIFFGSTGCGKSSIVNMLLGDNAEKAPVSGNAKGCTFANDKYITIIDGEEYRLFDTSGLDEGSGGKVLTKDAIINLYRLLQGLDDGVSLLVYCMRGPRITESIERNYKVFYDGFCHKNVRIVIVVTGLEDHPKMETWWVENEHAFKEYKLEFDGHACITATRGKKMGGAYRNQVEYEESQKALKKLIVNQCQSVAEPFRMNTGTWLASIMGWLRRNMPWLLGPELEGLYNVLVQFLPEKEAREIADRASEKGSINSKPQTSSR